MLFNTFAYALFLPIVFVLYWHVFGKNRQQQNALLLACSYFFYSCWDWRFLFLLLFSTLLDFFSGIMIEGSRTERARKRWLWLSISINLGFLGFFKYYNFFIGSMGDLLTEAGWPIEPWILKIVLPIGISFYTLHGLSYIIDVYKRKLPAERSFVDYAVFVSFFPLLVAGPIERATHLLPQIKTERVFNASKAVDGLRQILWGLFKKMVIADNCARFAQMMFDHPDQQSGSNLVLGAIFFTFQVYGDFSGYSDIALGSARLLGIDLLKNFSYPFFSRDTSEFWRRWHISLSSWFKDYVYLPLGGSKGGKLLQIRNTFIIFMASALWHGAAWTYVVWGIMSALFFLPSILRGERPVRSKVVAEGKLLPSFKETYQMLATFSLFAFSMIVFRSDSLSKAWAYLKGICTSSLFSVPDFVNKSHALVTFLLIGLLLVMEWRGRYNAYALESWGLHWKRRYRWAAYALLIFIIGLFQATEETPFVYFQF